MTEREKTIQGGKEEKKGDKSKGILQLGKIRACGGRIEKRSKKTEVRKIA